MLVLAVDTATPAVTAGLVDLEQAATQPLVRTLASRVTVDARAHNEVLTPQILACLAEADRTRTDIGAVVVGIGPGPFTGLRVGMATAAAFGDALGLPVHGVCSLDAIAAEAWPEVPAGQDESSGAELLVVTDARRREVYWARYRRSGRVDGPGVCKPVDLDSGDATAIAGSPSHVDFFDLPVLPAETPSPAGLVRCAAHDILARATPQPLVPLYLRRPDAVERSYQAVR
ncbi:tRNA (adenosine(37)-N6)-threonylcarbamoyltransferase complex dimerization subunit type 1 TsaB [Nocardia nova]|uniref:tRNA (Adenosine(37)-N6)-threonylcarbamoyltransferase complex dimerization subunit type 1 TsaB n=1 Tax=Nocardia nova TaxID=37330 RepID=A0A2S6ANB9_9NOCA|nr:tRNA (adenosine(37)-N6)-threonylcarbamoyltransferase complex dimerization subunit type 1 TsaB [Nocardia nova]PPJ23300.1 tRNA (adenosine(37)-N6)-threonylcarbamoyltransferase complex dimerization subunit type 1 TsaB [Nocardia nova]PPJ36712.1 tRNA (adenosine(37)-N6)-threonylcarbamoyltransferase complex dimerization subunit type 1 TsaB [Nocardia nova]